ncbi:MAG: hypothetical protein ACW99G_07960 [Candidatus Thorarchaeota archaeon]|jgi:hypothetical protein
MEGIAKFKGRHRGERGFIACNGPSLNGIDTKRLDGEIVFGLNRGYLKKDLHITYLVTIDDLIENQFREEMENFECEAKFSHSLRNSYKLYWTHDVPKFSPSIAVPIWQGHSVTNVALQVAFYMGFKEIYIIGMDHFIDYSETEKVGGKFINKGGDLNHFDPNYFAGEVKYNNQNLERVELGYKLAREYYEGSGRKLYNASTKTKLSEDIIPRIDFESIWQ